VLVIGLEKHFVVFGHSFFGLHQSNLILRLHEVDVELALPLALHERQFLVRLLHVAVEVVLLQPALALEHLQIFSTVLRQVAVLLLLFPLEQLVLLRLKLYD